MENDTSCKYLSKGNRTGVTVLISNILTRAKKITRDRDGCYTMIQESIHKEDRAVLSACSQITDL